jgi:hypothetical protein
LRVVKLENALYNQDKLLCKIFRENKMVNLKLESASFKIATLRSAHNDMSDKSYDNCKMIMINYVDLCLLHSHVASLLNGARFELRELKAHSTLIGACTTCHLLRSDLESAAVEIKNLMHKIDHSSRYVLSPPCEACVSLNVKFFHAIKENTELQHEIAYLTTRLEKIILNEKMIERDLSRVEKSAIKSTYRLGIEFKRCEKKRMRMMLLSLFLPPATIKKSKHSNQSKPKTHPIQSYPSIQRGVKRESLKSREEAFVCMFCGRAGYLDEFCFRRKRIERMRVDYARNSYRDEFIDFPPRSYSHILPYFYSHASSHTSSRVFPQFSYGPNHCSYSFGP